MSERRSRQRLLGVREVALEVDITDRRVPAAMDGDPLDRARSDPRAFADVYERYRLSVYRFLRTRGASDDEAADLTAETFERAIRAIRGYRGSGSGIGWLLRIARNAAVDASRRRPRTLIADEADLLWKADGVETPEAAYLAAERSAELRAAIAGLPDASREAIALRYAVGLSTREIAVVIGKSEAATQKLISRALAVLREDHHAED